MPFILPKQMFLSCLIDVTHISAKTPHSSPAWVRIIARSSMKQCSTPLALQKQQPFLRFMFQTELATQDAFLSLFWKRKGIRLENVHTRWLRWRPLWLFSSWSKWDSHQRDDGLNQEVCVPAGHLKLPLLPLGSPTGNSFGPSSILLTYVNDLPNGLHSEVTLFADDAQLYHILANDANYDQRQKDLPKLEERQHRWRIEFKPS